ncbi:MAG: class I SAM-dependent methyltransferase [Planctomycetota bacterium]|jgi:ubiquinone/menaquinone biosynthesis C-methylase UbiE
MSKRFRVGGVILAILFLCLPAAGQQKEPSGGRGSGSMGGKGYRGASSYVVKRLGLRRKSVVVDIGAGDGWWSSKMAEKLGVKGVIHAGEIDQKKVDAMKEKWEATPQIKPYLCPTDGTGLEENSCDLAFISKTYHHFDKDNRVDYFRHLKKVIKPSGRVVIIEAHADFASGSGKEHAVQPGLLVQKAEQAGWMLLRYELIPDSAHFMATFVKPENFTEKHSRRLKAAKRKQSKGDQ